MDGSSKRSSVSTALHLAAPTRQGLNSYYPLPRLVSTLTANKLANTLCNWATNGFELQLWIWLPSLNKLSSFQSNLIVLSHASPFHGKSEVRVLVICRHSTSIAPRSATERGKLWGCIRNLRAIWDITLTQYTHFLSTISRTQPSRPLCVPLTC